MKLSMKLQERFVWMAGVAISILALQLGCQRQESAESEPPASAPPASTASQRATSPKAAPAYSRPSASSQPATVARSVTLAAGTPLKVRTTSTISTNLQQAGDSFTAILEEPLRDGNVVVADKGSTVEGTVVEADKGGRVKGVASMAIALNRLHAGGRTIEISTNSLSVEAQSTKKKDAVKVGIGAAVGTAIGAIAGGKKGAGIGAATGAGAGTAVVLSTRGDAAEIASETVLAFELRAPVTVR